MAHVLRSGRTQSVLVYLDLLAGAGVETYRYHEFDLSVESSVQRSGPPLRGGLKRGRLSGRIGDSSILPAFWMRGSPQEGGGAGRVPEWTVYLQRVADPAF